MPMNARPRKAWPARSVNREPLSWTSFAESGRDGHQEDDRRQDRGAGLERVVAEHVLEVLLVDEGDAHERPEHDDAGARRDPEGHP